MQNKAHFGKTITITQRQRFSPCMQPEEHNASPTDIEKCPREGGYFHSELSYVFKGRQHYPESAPMHGLPGTKSG